MTDGHLVRQTLAGDRSAYEELVRRWSARILAFCHAKVGTSHAAEDLAQEALLRGYRGLPTLSNPEQFGSWLHGIALRTCLDWLKRKENGQVGFGAIGATQEGVPAPDDLPLDRLARDEQLRTLLAEVEALPDECREVIMLYYYQDVTYQQIADALGVSAATVNARLTKARKLLRQRMTRFEMRSDGLPASFE
ncbi:MAG TPA: RNA polymerase sigma factor [Pirellulales bacterium]|nr:RNA polymerase sigma factor [Pirellulales bacterium]